MNPQRLQSRLGQQKSQLALAFEKATSEEAA
jgi:hypothetical protein